MKKSVAVRLVAACVAMGALPAAAQSVWSGATDALWSTPTNWSVPPVSSNTLAVFFTGPSANLSPAVDSAYTLNSLVMGTAASYTLGGLSALSFNGTNPQLIVQGPGHVIGTLLLLSAPTTFVMGDSLLVGDVAGNSLAVNGGPGTLTMAGSFLPNTTTVDAPATLRLGNGVSGPIAANSAVVVNSTLETNGGFTGFVNDVTGSGSVHAIGGPGNLNNMSHTGTTTVDAGANLFGRITNNALLTVNGTFDTTGSTVGSLTGTTAGTLQITGGTLTLGSDNTDATYLGAILGGSGGVTKVGSGRQILGQQLTYNGPTLVSAGTLRIGLGTIGTTGVLFAPTTNAALEIDALGGMNFPDGLTGTGTLEIMSGTTTSPVTLLHQGTTTVDAGAQLQAAINNNALLSVNGIFHATGGGTTVGSLSGAGAAQVFIDSPTLILGGDNTDQVYAGINLGGAGSLVKNGSGRQTIAVTGMYFGNTTINAGTLRFGNGVIAGPGFVFNSIVNNGAIEFNVPSGVSFNNGLSGSGTLRVVGGSATVTGTTLHAGATTIDAGATFNGAINNNAPLTVNGTINLNALATTVGSLTGSGLVNINAATFTVGGDNSSTTYSGTFGIGGNTLVKVGTGTLTLTGNSGGVVASANVNAGTLLVNGQHIASGTQVASGATLGGSGRVGPVSVNAGGFISPGNSPGLLTTASLFLGGTLLQEIQGPARGAQYDAVDANGGVVLLAGSTLVLSGAYVPVVGDTFTIIANDGVDPVNGTFTGLAQGATINFNGVPLTISYVGGTGNDVVLAALAPAPAGLPGGPIPTLSEWMLVLLALLMMTIGLLRRMA